MRAFRTSCEQTVSIVFAERASIAKAVTMRAAREVGYRVSFTDVRAWRAPEYDRGQLLGGQAPMAHRCYNLHYMLEESAMTAPMTREDAAMQSTEPGAAREGE